jgi:hypothetical protein
VINITGNFLNQILELLSTVDTVSAPSMSGILKLAIFKTIDNLDRRMVRRVKLVQQSINEGNYKMYFSRSNNTKPDDYMQSKHVVIRIMSNGQKWCNIPVGC